MQKKGLNSVHGLIASVLAILFLLFGGYIIVPLFGESGGLYAGIFIALIGVLFTVLTNTDIKDVFPFKLPPIRKFFGAFFMYLSLMMFNASVSVVISKLFDPDVRNNEIGSIILGMSPFAAIIVVAVLPALCEEFFCRGFLVRCFDGIKNKKLVILIVAIVFGVMHLDLYSFFPTALTGAFFCFLSLKTNSILIPIFLHFINNAFSVVMTFLSVGDEATTEGISSISQLPILPSISMAVIYIGMAIIPFYIVCKLFNDKKVFSTSAIIAATLTISLVACGTTAFLVTSYTKYKESTVTVESKNEVASEEEIVLEDGSYVFNMTFASDNIVDVKVYCNDKIVAEYLGQSTGIIATSIEASGSLVRIVILPSSQEAGQATVEYKYSLMKRVY